MRLIAIFFRLTVVFSGSYSWKYIHNSIQWGINWFFIKYYILNIICDLGYIKWILHMQFSDYVNHKVDTLFHMYILIYFLPRINQNMTMAQAKNIWIYYKTIIIKYLIMCMLMYSSNDVINFNAYIMLNTFQNLIHYSNCNIKIYVFDRMLLSGYLHIFFYKLFIGICSQM